MDRLAAMETLVRVVDAGSFSGASKQLNIGQPSVSKTIAQLEDRLGVRLLFRSTKGLTPTEAGRAFYERAKRTLAEAEEAELIARSSGNGFDGRLRVSVAITFARLHVLPRLSEFLERNPSLDIDVVMDDSHVDLIEGGIDLAIRMGELADSTFTGRRIGRSRRLVVGTAGYFQLNGHPASPADLAQHETFFIANGEACSARFHRGEEEFSANVRGRLRVNTGEGVRSAVLAGLGVGIGSEWLFEPELADGTMIETLADWELAPLDLWAVFPSGRRVSAKARAFAEFVEQIVSSRSV